MNDECFYGHERSGHLMCDFTEDCPCKYGTALDRAAHEAIAWSDHFQTKRESLEYRLKEFLRNAEQAYRKAEERNAKGWPCKDLSC